MPDLSDMAMFYLLRRADRAIRKLRVACVWNTQLNANVERILNAPLRDLDRMGNVVQPGERVSERDRRQADFDGKLAALARRSDDLRDLEARETVRATLSGDELKEWENRNCPT